MLDKEEILRKIKEEITLLLNDEDINPEIWDDKEFVLKVVNRRGEAIRYASDRLKDDNDVARTAIIACDPAIRFVSERLRSDREFLINTLSDTSGIAWGNVLSYVSEELKDDKEFVMVAVKRHGFDLDNASDRLKDDKEVVIAAIGDDTPTALEFASERLQKDPELIELVKKLEEE